MAGEALFFLPWIWVPLALCLWRAARSGPKDSRKWLLACLSLPTFLLFELVSLRGHVLFHWAAPATMLALPLLGDLVGRVRRDSRAVRAGLTMTAVTVVLGAVLVGTEVRFNWLPDVIEDFAMGNDPDIGAVDWTSLRSELHSRKELPPGTVVAATRWLDAGKVDYALAGEAEVICLGEDPREYGIVSPAAAYIGSDMLIVAPKETLASIEASLGGHFDWIEPLAPITLLHAGKPAMLLPIFRGHHYQPVPRAFGRLFRT